MYTFEAVAQDWNIISTEKAKPLSFSTEVINEWQPGSVERELELSVQYLSDSLRGGRTSGSRGAVDAAMLIDETLRYAGLETSSVSFLLDNNRIARDIIGICRSTKTEGKWILVLAYYDGLTASDGKAYPGADSNASGIAALMELARRIAGTDRNCNYLFAALDGHYSSLSGAKALWEALPSLGIRRQQIAVVANLDTIGSILSPPQKFWKNYLIALGGLRYEKSLGQCNNGLEMHLYFDYYESRTFTDMFYLRVSDHRIFLEHGVPCVMFTSGITMNTNRLTDTYKTLNYPIFAKRVELIGRWLEKISD